MRYARGLPLSLDVVCVCVCRLVEGARVVLPLACRVPSAVSRARRERSVAPEKGAPDALDQHTHTRRLINVNKTVSPPTSNAALAQGDRCSLPTRLPAPFHVDRPHPPRDHGGFWLPHARDDDDDHSRASTSIVVPCARAGSTAARSRRNAAAAERLPPAPRKKPKQASASAAAAPEPKHLLLNYSYVPDILEKRGPHREAHLAGAQKKLEEGKLICAGAVGAPPKGATFFFKGASRAEVEQFVKDDAYVQNGLVTAWSIDPYTVVVGDP